MVSIVHKSPSTLTFYLFFAIGYLPFFLGAQISNPTQAEIQKIHGLDEVLMGNINDIYCDTNNFIWICDPAQVIRYNGHHYRTIGTDFFTGNFNLQFFEDDFGRPWLISLSGEIGYIKNDYVKDFAYNDTVSKLIYRASYESVYFDRDSTLHLGTKSYGYYKIYKDGKLERKLSDSDSLFGVLAVARKGHPPVISSTSLASQKNEEPYSFYYLDEQMNVIFSEPFDNKNRLYLSSLERFGDSSYLYSGGNNELFHFDEKGLKHHVVYDYNILHTLVDENDGIWLGTVGEGTHFFSSMESLVSGEKPVVYLEGEISAAVCEDKDKGLWFKSSKDIYYITAPQVRRFTSYPGLGETERIKVVAATDSFAYVASDTEINRINRNGKITHLPLSPLLSKKKIDQSYRALYYDTIAKCLWAGGARAQLYYWQNGKWGESSAFQKANITQGIKKIMPHPEPGTLCIIAGAHFNLIKNDSVIYHRLFQNQELTDVAFTPDGKTWVASSKSLGYIKNGEYVDVTDNYPMMSAPFYSLYYHQGRLWVNDDRNRGYIDSKNNFHSVSEISGHYAFNDPDNGLWFPTCCEGLVHQLYEGDSLSGSINYNVSTSIARSIFNSSFIWGDSLFIGSPNGLFLAVENELDTYRSGPKTFIEDVFINGHKREPARHYEVEYDENFLQIDFTGIFYTNGKQYINYRYKLEGLKDEWITGIRNFAQFTNLNPGHYTFILQSRIGNRPYSEPLKLTFTIAPPFWETWWFRLVGLLTISGLIILLFRNRLKAQRKRSQLEIDKLRYQQSALRAQMNPHFIFNAMSSIQQMVFNNESENAADHIALFARLMRQVLDLSQKELVSLAEEFELLNNYLGLEFIRFNESLKFSIETSTEVPADTIGIPPLLIQPLVENALKHGLLGKGCSEGEIKIRAYFENDFMVVEVRDNGVGYRTKKKSTESHQSFGLRSTYQRIELVNMSKKNKMKIDINPAVHTRAENPGTTVKVYVPNKEEYYI